MDNEINNEEGAAEQNVAPQQQTPEEPAKSPPFPGESGKSPMGKGLVFLVLILVVIVVLGMKGNIPESLKFWSKHKSTVTKDVDAKSDAPSPFDKDSSNNSDDMPSAQGSAKTTVNKEEVQSIIKNYLNENPEIVMDALRNLEHKMAQQRTKDSKDFIDKNADKLSENRPFLGNASGNKVVMEFFDYKCGHCKSSYFTLEKVLKEDTGVKVVLINIPVLGNNSMLAAKASIAMWNLSPKNFVSFHGDLINTSDISEKTIETLAQKYKISKDSLLKEMNSPQVQQEITNNMQMAHQLGVQGVPAFVINGEFISGGINYESLKQKLGDTAKSNNTGTTAPAVKGQQNMPMPAVKAPPMPAAAKAVPPMPTGAVPKPN